MPPKLVIGFERTNLQTIKGKVGHSRTGACTAKGRCFHGMRPTPRLSRKGKKG